MTAICSAPPTRHFCDHVSAFYLIETEATCLEQIEPAGRAQMRFILRGTASVQSQNGAQTDLATVALIGPRNQASSFRIDGPARIFGFGLRPQGWCATTRLRACDLADQAGDGRHQGYGPIGQVYARLCEAKTFRDMIGIAEKYLEIVARHMVAPPRPVIDAIEDWLCNSPNPRIADLLTQSGLTGAQVQRQCKTLFGAPPKLLARKHRALLMAKRIADGERDWQSDIDRIFYDQSHCIRELRQFIGRTPSAIRAQPGPLSFDAPVSESGRGWARPWPAS